jgi:anaerobic ribonucleoside-triphosphate reductase activating protein
MSPHTWDPTGGVEAAVEDVATWIQSVETTNLTISGGEPTDQAASLVELLDLLDHEVRVTVYSGYDLSALRARSDVEINALLARADLLIAGPYVRSLHASLLWRGSSNQRIHNLSGRIPIQGDVSAGVEFRAGRGTVGAVGVPPSRDFRSTFAKRFREQGLDLGLAGPDRAWPFPTQPRHDD